MRINTDYLHVLDGRMRIKVPEVKNAPDQARRLETHLNYLEGITKVSANTTTGNVLILYNPEHAKKSDIVQALWDLGYLRDSGAREQKSRARSTPGSDNLMEWVAGSVAQSVLEIALTRVVTALI